MNNLPPEGDIADKLHISESNLGEECLTQSALYWVYAEAFAYTKKMLQKELDKFALCKAELDGEIRKQYIDDGVKFTEAVVNADIIKSAKYQDIQNSVRGWESVKDMYELAVRAFQQRKDMLDNLVKLNIAGLHSTPNLAQQDLRDKLNKRS